MWIMICGPYTSGSIDPTKRAENLRMLNRLAVDLFRAGHVPIIGVNMALPMIDTAGAEAFDDIMPISLALAERCDACLRIGGASQGADREVEHFRSRGRPVYDKVEDVPPA